MDGWTCQYWKDGDWWLGRCLDFKQQRFCAQERTYDECVVSLQAAIDDMVGHLRAYNLPVPNPGDAVRVIRGPYGVWIQINSDPMGETAPIGGTTTG